MAPCRALGAPSGDRGDHRCGSDRARGQTPQPVVCIDSFRAAAWRERLSVLAMGVIENTLAAKRPSGENGDYRVRILIVSERGPSLLETLSRAVTV